MPFNRDLIESGCALKTFDGDLSVLERVIDWTVTKTEFSKQKCESTVVVPVSTKLSIDACKTVQRRHIKEVVHGENFDELSLVQEIGTRNDPAPRQVSQVSGVAAVASGFCFRHTADDVESISHVFQQSTGNETVLQSSRPAIAAQIMHLPVQTTKTTRVARSVKDVVYGELDFDRQCGQEGQSNRKCDVQSKPQPPVNHFKSCMREMCSSVDSVPRASVAAMKQMSPESSHTHWRSAIHGF